jgi:pimeloyl-ACP methyl ester carboxylesterase
MDIRREEKLIQLGGLTFNYLEWGRARAPLIIALHGIGDDAHIWDQFALAAAAEGLRIIAPDQRGHGLTSWAEPPAYTCDDYVGDLGKLVDALQLKGFVLMGHSMGALHATSYAARQPKRTAGLIHADIEPHPPAWNKKYLLNQYNDLPFFYDSVEEYMVELRKNCTFADDRKLHEIALSALVRGEDGKFRTRYDREVLAHFDPLYDLTPCLKDIACPSLVIRGKESRVMSSEAARDMSRAISRGTFAEVPDAAHPLHVDNPEGFQRAVLGFIRENGFI